MNNFQIRKAIPADLSRIVELCGLHAEFERSKVERTTELQEQESQEQASQEREAREHELQKASSPGGVAANRSYPQNGESSCRRLIPDGHQRPKVAALRKLLFGDSPSIHCLVAECKDTVEGFATFMPQFSTWEANQYLYVDCLYLTEQTRGLGIGKQLMETIRGVAFEMNCLEIQWQTPIFNDAAIQFYLKLGAECKAKQRFTWKINDDNES